MVLSHSLQVYMYSYFYYQFLYHDFGNHLFLTHSFYIYELSIFLFYTCSTRLLCFLKNIFRTPLYMSQQRENTAICMEFHLLDHFSGKELFKILRNYLCFLLLSFDLQLHFSIALLWTNSLSVISVLNMNQDCSTTHVIILWIYFIMNTYGCLHHTLSFQYSFLKGQGGGRSGFLPDSCNIQWGSEGFCNDH